MPTPIHRDTANKLLIGLVTGAVGAVVAYVGITVQGGGELPGKAYTLIDAQFSDVGTLKPQEKVTVSGARVGIVTGIDYVDGIAVAHLRIDGHTPVYRDATAQIGNESALGKKLVNLDLGTETAGDLGSQAIPLSQTAAATDLDSVLSMFKPEVREGLSTGLQEVGGGALGHGDDLNRVLAVAPDVLADARKITTTLSDPDTDLTGLVETTNQLVGRFQDREEQIAGLVDDASETLGAVTVDDAKPLDSTLSRLPDTLRTARDALHDVNGPLADVAAAAQSLRPGARSLGNSATDLRGFLRESLDPLRKVPGVSESAVPAVDELTHTLIDARPLVSRLRTTLISAAPFLQALAPFAPDAGRLVSYNDMLSGHYTPEKHFFSAMLAFPGLYNVSLPDPLANVDPYPGPGNAWGPNGGLLP